MFWDSLQRLCERQQKLTTSRKDHSFRKHQEWIDRKKINLNTDEIEKSKHSQILQTSQNKTTPVFLPLVLPARSQELCQV